MSSSGRSVSAQPSWVYQAIQNRLNRIELLSFTRYIEKIRQVKRPNTRPCGCKPPRRIPSRPQEICIRHSSYLHMRCHYIYRRRRESRANAQVAVGVEAKAHTLLGECRNLRPRSRFWRHLGMPVRGGGCTVNYRLPNLLT